MSREWGIYPENCTPSQWWGARAIINRGKFELLPDRQNYERQEGVSDRDKGDFFFWLENSFDIAVKQALNDGKFKTAAVWTMDSSSGRFHAEATTRDSGGYLYVGVWEVGKA